MKRGIPLLTAEGSVPHSPEKFLICELKKASFGTFWD